VILESLTHLSSPTSPGRPTHSFKARHTNKSTQGRLKSVNQNSKLISVHCRVILEHFTVYSFNSWNVILEYWEKQIWVWCVP